MEGHTPITKNLLVRLDMDTDEAGFLIGVPPSGLSLTVVACLADQVIQARLAS